MIDFCLYCGQAICICKFPSSHNPSIEGHGGRAVAMSSPAIFDFATRIHTHVPCTD